MDTVNCVVPPSQLLWVLIIASLSMALMGAMIGANDMANVLATSVGSKSLNLLQATIIGVIFIIIGSVFLGSRVASTIRSDILTIESFSDNPSLLMFGMTSALIGASLWLFLATRLGWPVSTTHSITGALIGVGLATGKNNVNWAEVTSIVLSWIASPILAAILGGIFFSIVRAVFLRSKHAIQRSYRFLGVIIFLITDTFILSFMLQTTIIFPFACPQKDDGIIETFAPCEIEKWVLAQPIYAILVSIAISLVLTAIFSAFAYPFANRVMKRYAQEVVEEEGNNSMKKLNDAIFIDVHKESYKERKKSYELYQNLETFQPEVEKFFTVLQILSASFDTMALGASDIANTAGPFAAVISIYQLGYIIEDVDAPMYILLIGGVFIALGMAGMGYHVIKTLGVKLLSITPSRGFSIEMSSAWVTLFFTNTGIPLSSTHCQVGASVGVGIVERRDKSQGWKNLFGKSVDWPLFGLIISSWVLTLIVAGSLSAAIFSFGVYGPSIHIN